MVCLPRAHHPLSITSFSTCTLLCSTHLLPEGLPALPGMGPTLTSAPPQSQPHLPHLLELGPGVDLELTESTVKQGAGAPAVPRPPVTFWPCVQLLPAPCGPRPCGEAPMTFHHPPVLGLAEGKETACQHQRGAAGLQRLLQARSAWLSLKPLGCPLTAPTAT